MNTEETIELDGCNYRFLEELKVLDEKVDGRECAVRPCVDTQARPGAAGRVPVFTVEFVREADGAWTPTGVEPMVIRNPQTDEPVGLDWDERTPGYYMREV